MLGFAGKTLPILVRRGTLDQLKRSSAGKTPQQLRYLGLEAGLLTDTEELFVLVDDGGQFNYRFLKGVEDGHSSSEQGTVLHHYKSTGICVGGRILNYAGIEIYLRPEGGKMSWCGTFKLFDNARLTPEILNP